SCLRVATGRRLCSFSLTAPGTRRPHSRDPVRRHHVEGSRAMRKPLFALCVSVLATIALLSPARAQFGSGGHDETTEDFNSATAWNAGTGQPATPGTVPPGVTGTHLMISVVGVRVLNTATLGDSTEFIEIYNPTNSSVHLSNFYISDANADSALPR